MILVGRNLSPFARRVAIWCALQGRDIERNEIAALDPAARDELRSFHPGLRVPALKIDDGTVLIETSAICDWLDETMPQQRLVPESGLARRDCLQRIALANATAEKTVSLVYEVVRRPSEFTWPAWRDRLVMQVEGGLDAMEAAVPADGFYGGATPDGSDIATVCAYQMVEFTNPSVLEKGYPKLAAFCARAMELEPFKTTYPTA